MNPLAEMLLRSGGAATGCDLDASLALKRLTQLGMKVYHGHDPSHIEGATAVVVTSAVPAGHPELQAARAAAIPVIKRAEALASWVSGGKVVAVAGTHGKTTTTALATHLLESAGADPTGVVGGEVPAWGGNLRLGNSDLFVVEADEYDRSFHTLRPDLAVVTNLEADHLDIYGDLARVRDAFAQFVQSLRPGGELWLCADDSGAARLATAAKEEARTYGLAAGSRLRASDVRSNGAGSFFSASEAGNAAVNFRLPLPGLHNVHNALAAIGVARSWGASWPQIQKGLASFPGVDRRYTDLGQSQGVQVIDDYAHHPTEVAATLGAVRQGYPDRRLVAVFQPHLYSRTRDFYQEFGEVLAEADTVWVTDIYPAREEPLPGVTGALVAEAITEKAADTFYHADLSTLASAVAATLAPGDVCVVMGAGSIERTGPEIVSILRGISP